MNRQFKFRVWISECKKMIYPKPYVTGSAVDSEDLLIRLDGIVCWIPKPGRIDKVLNEYTLMQSTGLKDKNDKEIYEGDIIKCLIDDEQHIFPIEWNVDKESSGWEIGRYTECEIIGNIYENEVEVI